MRSCYDTDIDPKFLINFFLSLNVKLSFAVCRFVSINVVTTAVVRLRER